MKKKFLVLSLGFLLFSGAILTDVACNKANIPSAYNVATTTPTPSYTPTITGTPTNTPIASPIFFNVTVNYNGVIKTGVSYNIVDQAGVTVATTTNTAPYSYTAYDYGTYTINILPNNPYALSTQTVLVTGPGLVTIAFSATGFTLQTTPTSLSYQSSIGYQIPVVVDYSMTGNLNIPCNVTASGLPSAFSNSPTNVVLQPNTSATETIYRNSCYVQNTSLQFSGSDLSGTGLISTTTINLNKGYPINVTLYATSSVSSITSSDPGDPSAGHWYCNETDTAWFSDGGLGCSYTLNLDGTNYSISGSNQVTTTIQVNDGGPVYSPNPSCSSSISVSLTLPNGQVISGTPGAGNIVGTGSY